jgi:asparagine synthase (glutamine-hydrolysing)
MCGINGILALNGARTPAHEAELRQAVESMNAAIAHRGPDGGGVYSHRALAFGHRRLSIIDLSDNAAQPMFNEDGTVVLVFNGEIYNFVELVPELTRRGHRFRSHSDSEVIIHAYEEWGPECVTRFNGMWAFALYDARRELLLASRDRFGVKPFYYHLSPERFCFSSEIKAVLRAADARDANAGKVYDYLAYGYKTNNAETFFRDVQELAPATNLVIERGKLKSRKYWTLPDAAAEPRTGVSIDELAGQFRDLLTDAIRLRFRSDVPVAILLSGGLDSTAIARVVEDLAEAGVLDYTSVKAFSAAFPGYHYDESDIVRRFVEGCRHIKLQQVFPGADELTGLVESIAYALGEPVFSTTVFAHYRLMREVHADGTKVVINGQGSDESFAGYDRYYLGYVLLDKLLSKPSEVVPQARAMHSVLGYSYTYIMKQLAKAVLPRRYASRLRGKYQEGVIPCLAPNFVATNYGYLRNGRRISLTPRNFDSYLRDQLEFYGFNQILHYEDHSSMAHSIEIRSPFVDYRLMEFAFSLPSHAKYDRGESKRVIRRALADRLPREVIECRRKIGFATPFNQWLSQPRFRSLVNDIIGSAAFGNRSIWNARMLRERFAQPERFPDFPFWRILNLELWARAYDVQGI